MRKLTLETKDYIRQSLYDVKKDYLKQFPEYNVEKPWDLKWKKLYFVKVNLDNND